MRTVGGIIGDLSYHSWNNPVNSVTVWKDIHFAHMMKLVDLLVSKASSLRSVGSSPTLGTSVLLDFLSKIIQWSWGLHGVDASLSRIAIRRVRSPSGPLFSFYLISVKN